jgi:hypothetical protein
VIGKAGIDARLFSDDIADRDLALLVRECIYNFQKRKELAMKIKIALLLTVILALMAGMVPVMPANAETVTNAADSGVMVQDPEARTKLIFETFDKDNNNALDRDEFAKAVIMLFVALDRNGDEVLVAEELPYGWTADIKNADKNGDKKIQFSEAIIYIDQTFQERDANGDGMLSRDEVKDYFVKQKQQQQA